MPFILLVLLLPVTLYSQNVQHLHHLEREYVVYNYAQKEQPLLKQLTKKTYSKKCRLNQEETSFGFSRDYKPNMKKTYKYNFKGKLKKIYISYLIPEYNGYVKTFKVKLSYDRYGNITKQKSKNVYPTNKRSEYLLNSPFPNFKKKYIYNVYKQLVSLITSTWDSKNNRFILAEKKIITWKNNTPSELSIYVYNQGQWIQKTLINNITWLPEYTFPFYAHVDSLEEHTAISYMHKTEFFGSVTKKMQIKNLRTDSTFIQSIDTLANNNTWMSIAMSETKFNKQKTAEQQIDYTIEKDKKVEIGRKIIELKFDPTTNVIAHKKIKTLDSNKQEHIIQFEYDGYFKCGCDKIK